MQDRYTGDIGDFGKLGLQFGAMETEYARYTEEQRSLLRQYAYRYGLARSGASDFHGFDEKETFCNCFPYELYEDILGRKCKLDAARRDKNGLYDMSDIIKDKNE